LDRGGNGQQIVSYRGIWSGLSARHSAAKPDMSCICPADRSKERGRIKYLVW